MPRWVSLAEAAHLAWCSLEIRDRPNAVLKLGSAVPEILKGIALIYAVFTITPLPFLLKGALGKQALDVGRRLLQSWEVIDDPDEQLVFEAVFRLQGKRSGEILKLKDYSQGPALLESDVEGICIELGPSLARDVLKALASLKRRRIVTERDSRWSIVF